MIGRGRLRPPPRRRAVLFGALLVVLAGCGAEQAPPPTTTPRADVPAELAGMWVADSGAVRQAFYDLQRKRLDLAGKTRAERERALDELVRRADAFSAQWSLRLNLRADGTFVYRLAQAGMPAYLRAGRFEREDGRLTLTVEETKDEAGRTVRDIWPEAWRTHVVVWERGRLRFRTPGRDPLEILLYRE